MGEGAKLSHQTPRLDLARGATRTRLLSGGVVQAPQPTSQRAGSHGPIQRARAFGIAGLDKGLQRQAIAAMSKPENDAGADRAQERFASKFLPCRDI